ncbi:serine/threonine dehydratase [Actinoalloteichus hymeniacidonis]|uniref:serine/threonine dehydratase n=1 Tax=Actinoalloteichus hymeniacidonis TaxID=340345 RepID=UPI0008533201|nr:serine/threonine dehydratase [Actinoalloteichus hymeniacidonis]MBB5906560.1 threonine dehydratase [Actinoalloteichus hymeniacidonis]
MTLSVPSSTPVQPLDSSAVREAAERIRPYARRTPIMRVVVDGKPLVLKLEYLQLTGSFKLRGALNAVLSGDRPSQVITASGGNHGLGVAMGARLSELPVAVYVPATVPEGKARRIEALGAQLVRVDGVYADAARAAQAAAAESGARYVPAFDDSEVVAGQGTVAWELVQDAPEVDVIAVATGGGGLAAGTALAVAPNLTTISVEPQHCCSMHRALEAGEPVDAEVNSVAASGLGASRAGELPFAILSEAARAGSLRSVLVSDAQILAARDRLWEEFRIAVEPAAATPFAAWEAGLVPGSHPAIVLCGANTDWLPA